MKRSVAESARIIGVSAQQLKSWAYTFREYLSSGANPGKGLQRLFTESDVLRLAHVATLWEPEPDLEHIRWRISDDEWHAERFQDTLHRYTPILQSPPDNLDETWRHGFLFMGGNPQDFLELARNYRYVADAMLEHALKQDVALAFHPPVLFAFRHTLELYLKIIGDIEESTHSLEKCVRLVERRHGAKIGEPLRGWILELHKMDQHGTNFRYVDGNPDSTGYCEYWVDLVHFRFSMTNVFEMIDHAVLRLGMTGKPVKMRAKKRGD